MAVCSRSLAWLAPFSIYPPCRFVSVGTVRTAPFRISFHTSFPVRPTCSVVEPVSNIDMLTDLSLLSVPTPIVDFQDVMGNGALAGQIIHFDLVSLQVNNTGADIGICQTDLAHTLNPNAANNSCTPSGAPLIRSPEDSLAFSVTISFSATLHAYTGSSDSFTTYF